MWTFFRIAEAFQNIEPCYVNKRSASSIPPSLFLFCLPGRVTDVVHETSRADTFDISTKHHLFRRTFEDHDMCTAPHLLSSVYRNLCYSKVKRRGFQTCCKKFENSNLARIFSWLFSWWSAVFFSKFTAHSALFSFLWMLFDHTSNACMTASSL